MRAQNVTPIRACREGLETVRQAVGRSFVLSCGAPLLSSADITLAANLEDKAVSWKGRTVPARTAARLP